jgi:hypothetical protein
MEWYENGNLTVSGREEGDAINAIAGRTLAGRVYSHLSKQAGNPSLPASAQRLNIMVGSHAPLMAFASLSGLASHSGIFHQLPLPGSIMAWELFAPGLANSTPPAESDLFVRFLFRNGTDPSEKLRAYPLFGRPNSGLDIPWKEFRDSVMGVGITNPGKWCESCESAAVWCDAFVSRGPDSYLNGDPNATPNGGGGAGVGGLYAKGRLSPLAAGFLGAGVTLLAVLLALGVAAVLGGFRLTKRAGKGGNGGNRGSISSFGFSGFSGLKNRFSGFGAGAEKRGNGDADTVDVVMKDGSGGQTVVREERVGSWELREQNGRGNGAGAGDGGLRPPDAGVLRSNASYRSRTTLDDELTENPFVDPVVPSERV